MDFVHEAFQAQVRRHPDRTAVVCGEERLSYDRLNRWANRIAHGLRRHGVGRETLVGVCLPRTPALIPALLGVLKAGGAYVPLDPAYPDERLALIREDARLLHILDPATLTELAAPDESDPGLIGRPEDAAYVIYTSGTSGRPKGAVTEHRQLANLLHWMRQTYSGAELSGSLCAASICHDFSIVEIFPSLTAGGTVILAENMLELPTLPAAAEVTMISGVPSAMSAIVDEPLPPRLTTISVGGEFVSRALADRFYAHPGVQRVLHMYGPTECTTYSTMYAVPRQGTEILPLGDPVAGARLSIHDETGSAVPEGGIGELWIAGPVVVRGYLNRPDLTAERFVDRPGGDRAYRTGDLVSVHNGRLLIHGRADDQVKIRGYRVELGEIEVALAAHPSVRNAVARADDETLYAYAESADPALSENELRGFLGRRLPAYMVPSRVAILERFPLGPTGKTDRRTLAQVPFPDHGGAGPRDPVEAEVAAIVAGVLGREHVGVEDAFSDLGGHSLAAARVCAQVRSRLGVAVTFAEFAAGPTAAKLAALVKARNSTGTPTPSPAIATTHHADLNDMQRSYWTVRQIDRRPHATTVALRLRVDGISGRDALQRALNQLVVRHEGLRTRFVQHGERVVAEVCAPQEVELVDGRIEECRFDLAGGLLLRAAVQWHSEQAELTLFTDHIVFDGWSIGVIMRELAEILGGVQPPALPAAGALQPVPDPAHAQHWRNRLKGAAAPELGRANGSSIRVSRLVSPDVVRMLDSVGVTPFCACLSALGVLLGGYAGRQDVVLGTPFARRSALELDRVVGPLLGMLPVRLDVAPRTPFRELAQRTAHEVAQGLSHTDVDFDEMVAAVARQPGKPALPVVLSMQPEVVSPEVVVGGVRVGLLGEALSATGPDTTAFFINRTVAGTELIVDCPDGWFTEAEATELADAYLHLLDRVGREPDTAVGDLEIVSERTRADLIRLGSPPATRPPTQVVREVLAWARRTPDAVAIDAPDGRFTYAELEELSGRIAAGLLQRGLTAGEFVGVCLTRGRWLPVALLGVLRAGAAYVPLDPEHPVRRREFQIADCDLRIVLDSSGVIELAGNDPAPLPPEVSDVMYVLYTSGSTGQPKGVDVRAYSVGVNLAAMGELLRVGPGDVAMTMSPVSFDLAHFAIWLPLTTGGCSVLVDHATAIDGHALGRRIEEAAADVFMAPPTALRMLTAASWAGRPGLKVLSGGEALDPALARAITSLVDEMWNGYGPTEAAVFTTVQRVVPDTGAVPIGRPLPGYRLYVCDEAARLVPPGVPGELWIAGPAVAGGYRNRPDLTQAAFRGNPHADGYAYRTGDLVRWRSDGALDYLGRRDHQVKVRGFRVEPGEVETVLRDHPAVLNAAVAAHGPTGETHLIGYVVWRDEPSTFDDVETFLRTRLPDYMTPRRWLSLAELPLNHNGKVDRFALPLPEEPAGERQEPHGAMEKFLADAWATVLSRGSVSATDDFFELGGHSFAATRVVSRIWTALGVRVPVKTLFDAPVLADFAADVERIAREALGEEVKHD